MTQHHNHARLVVIAFVSGTALMALVGCSGPAGGAPEKADTTKFCTAYNDGFTSSVPPPGATKKAQNQALQAQQKWATRLAEVGTPTSIPDEARKGFETTLNTILDSETLDELAAAQADQDKDESANTLAFTEYATTTCQTRPTL